MGRHAPDQLTVELVALQSLVQPRAPTRIGVSV